MAKLMNGSARRLVGAPLGTPLQLPGMRAQLLTAGMRPCGLVRARHAPMGAENVPFTLYL